MRADQAEQGRRCLGVRASLPLHMRLCLLRRVIASKCNTVREGKDTYLEDGILALFMTCRDAA